MRVQQPQDSKTFLFCTPLSGHCLLDKPEEPLQLPTAFLGSDYDSDHQCQLSFGPDSRHCPNLHPPCSSLWCTGRINGQFMCQTKNFPWADGTPCGEGKNCMSGRCINKVELKAYNVSSPSRSQQGETASLQSMVVFGEARLEK